MSSRDTDSSVEQIASRLARENAFFRISERLAGIGHLVHDLVDDEIEWSDGLYAIMGYASDHASTANDLLSRVDPTDRGRVSSALSGADLRDTELDFGFTRGDGERRRARLWAEVHREASGRPRRLVAVVRDTTVDRAVVEVVRAVERRLTGGGVPAGPSTDAAGRGDPVHDDGALTADPPTMDGASVRAASRPSGH